MGLNASEVKSSGGGKRDVMEPGNSPARLVAVIDLGLQAQRPFKGEEKGPARELALTYEFTDVFMKDEDGKEDPEKPRWLTEIVPLYNISQDKARSTQRYKVFDPTLADGGDWAKQVTKPVNVNVVLNPKKDGKVYENVGGISPVRAKDADKLPALVNEPIVWDMDAPDLDTWKRIPAFLQKKAKENLEYEGSALQKLLGGEPVPAKAEEEPKGKAKAAAKVDDRPPY